MTRCVLDSSVALAWVLPGEGGASTEALLDEVASVGAAVPRLWPLETASVLLAAERRGRIALAERQQALAALKELPIHIDLHTAAHAWGDALHLASSRDLTLYNASLSRTGAAPRPAVGLARPEAARSGGRLRRRAARGLSGGQL